MSYYQSKPIKGNYPKRKFNAPFKQPGIHSHYNEKVCQFQYPLNKVRTHPHHPTQEFFPDPNRKRYVIENRTDEPQLLSISRYAWDLEDEPKFFTLPPFQEQSFHVNTALEIHQFVRIHDFNNKKIIDAKYLFPFYSLMSVFRDLECRPRLQAQKTPLF